MAEIAVGLATKQAEGLINSLVNRVSGELSLLLTVREDICFIKNELELMTAFLRKAEEKQNNNELAKAWVKQVKELAYAVEDCIDEFSLHLSCRSSNNNLVAALGRRAHSMGSLRARRRIATNIQSIRSRVKEVSESRLRYGIDEKAASTDRDVVAEYDPEDSVINCKCIKRLWIAESLISARRDMTAEEVAECYLNMLISRNMILPSNINLLGEIRGFTVHDMMMEMIVSISVEENFVSRILKDSTWVPQGVIRRLSMDSAGSIPDGLSLSYVRSLFLFGDHRLPSLLFVSPAFKLLRVLDLDGCRYFNNVHLDGVCQLLHLKYLSLRNTVVTTIPKSIGRLQNLGNL